MVPLPDRVGGLVTYIVNFRGFRACPCQAAWLPVFEAEAQRRGFLVGPLPLAQLIGDAAASGNTHEKGGATDWWSGGGVRDNDGLVWLARQMGADATWARTAAQGFDPHDHSVLTGCPHNGPARYQIDAVRADWNGLAGETSRAPDDGPRPLSGRTWQEGIKWATQQQEDDMASPESIKQITDALRPVIAEEVAKAVGDNKLDVGKKAKWADDTVDETILNRLGAIQATLEQLKQSSRS